MTIDGISSLIIVLSGGYFLIKKGMRIPANKIVKGEEK